MKTLKALMLFGGILIGLQSLAIQIQPISKIGELGHRVVFQSSDVRILKRNPNLRVGHLVAQWGLHVFEVGKVTYDCSSGLCRMARYERTGTFENCGLRQTRMSCSHRLSQSYKATANAPDFMARDLLIQDVVDGVQDEPQRIGTGADEVEFPARGNDFIDGRNQTDF